jgi:hypothetical protein
MRQLAMLVSLIAVGDFVESLREVSDPGTFRKNYAKQGKSGLRGYADSIVRWRDCRI